ncbi:MAG TPA: radical SAM protein [Bacteroidia bacterium]|jgi:MoaA/NifB/PqqE/SkfB family radical SAM enzyme|nr:radical SAM protein [Bacteroidia bacterium]
MRTNTAITRTKVSPFTVYKNVMKAAFDPMRPLLAQLVVTRRCNLSCGYCYEYDHISKAVPLDVLQSRIDEFKRLKVVFVTLNGGEPLIHPQISELVRYIGESGMIPMMNSNGRILNAKLIMQLNDAGLYGIQISCDSLEDNEVTKKSLKRLKPKLDLLKTYADFKVRINGVFGSTPPSEVLTLAKTILDYGFDFQCSLIRDETGAAITLSQEFRDVYMEIRKMKGRLPAFLNDSFQLPLINGENSKWKCRSGARHFEVDADGFVHLCQPRTKDYSKALTEYTLEDIKQNFYMEKTCSARCPVAYAHLGSRLDGFRNQNALRHE